MRKSPTPKPQPDAARKQQEISKFKGESKSYSQNRPKRKVLSRYAR